MIEVNHHDTILRTFILFAQSARAALKYADSTLYRETNLSLIKFIVLQSLVTNGGTMTASQLAEWTSTERHNITTLVDRMAKDEIITAQRDIRDKRFVNITLTDKGIQLLNQARPVARKVVDQVMLSIDEGDALVLEKLLSVLRRNADHCLEKVPKHSQRKSV